MSILGGGIFKGMAVTERDCLGADTTERESLPANDYSWSAGGALPHGMGD